MKLYFNYKLISDLHNTRNQKQPIDVFETIAKFYSRLGVIKMYNDIINVSKFKNFTFNSDGTLGVAAEIEIKNGDKFVKDTDIAAEISDERLGYIEIDEAKLTALGKTIDEVKAYVQLIGTSFSITFMTSIETSEWIKRFTNLPEIETNKFELNPASDFEGDSYPAKYLIIV